LEWEGESKSDNIRKAQVRDTNKKNYNVPDKCREEWADKYRDYREERKEEG